MERHRSHADQRLQPAGAALRAVDAMLNVTQKLSASRSRIRRGSTLRSAEPRTASPPRRNPALSAPISATASCRRRPNRPAPCTSPRAAISARRSSSASARAATCIAPSTPSGSTANSLAPAAARGRRQAVGELTSVAAIPLAGGEIIHLGLGYVRREALDRGASLIYPGGVATPVSLPFLAAAASERPAASESSERV